MSLKLITLNEIRGNWIHERRKLADQTVWKQGRRRNIHQPKNYCDG